MSEQLLKQILNQFHQLKEKLVQGLDHLNQQLGRETHQLNEKFDQLNQRLDHEIHQLNGKFDHLNQRLDREIHQLNERLDQVENNMATKEDVADLPLIKRAVLDASDSIKRLEEIQENQQRIIDLLSARSIQHEAELKRIK
ncbi:hypothetical protein LG52_2989 [Geobacillus kaustophilus]|uniref:Uncharacterized protein n=1 Tax=Geobacillus kaustophilus TaxID=1462 RepID=A0A0D8BPU0_GEOKU|nr:hypothetical protein [Geobacillus kaustophilus]KJE26166.1 hypothetical protein LG52_2989 [Geobacillus kaustophilus]